MTKLSTAQIDCLVTVVDCGVFDKITKDELLSKGVTQRTIDSLVRKGCLKKDDFDEVSYELTDLGDTKLCELGMEALSA